MLLCVKSHHSPFTKRVIVLLMILMYYVSHEEVAVVSKQHAFSASKDLSQCPNHRVVLYCITADTKKCKSVNTSYLLQTVPNSFVAVNSVR